MATRILALFPALMLFVCIPSAVLAAVEPCRSSYVVVRGDTLNRIANRCRTNVSALLAANPSITNPNLIKVGMRLTLYRDVIPGPFVDYEVTRGDTLRRIAARFDTSLHDILAANSHIANPNRILAGQRLHVPIPRVAGPPAIATELGGTAVEEVDIFLIALENGDIGCGDRLVPMLRRIDPTRAPLVAALSELLSIKERELGLTGLYNPLYQSDLQVESVTVEDGRATILLTGNLRLSGVCDNPRVEAQFDRLARQFSTVQQVDVRVNGVPLRELLSGQG
jgi:LysM repeat protein